MAGFDFNRNTLDYLQSKTLETHDLPRVVGHETQFFETQIGQDLGPNTIIPEVRLKTQFLIGLDGIIPLILQGIGLQLVDQSDAATLLADIEKNTPPLLGNHI